jgi:hypothetical protein
VWNPIAMGVSVYAGPAERLGAAEVDDDPARWPRSRRPSVTS